MTVRTLETVSLLQRLLSARRLEEALHECKSICSAIELLAGLQVQPTDQLIYF